MKYNQRTGSSSSSKTKSGPRPDETQEMHDNIMKIKQILPDWKVDDEIRIALEENDNNVETVIGKYLEGQNTWFLIPKKSKNGEEKSPSQEKKKFPGKKRNAETDDKQQSSGIIKQNRPPRPQKVYQPKKK